MEAESLRLKVQQYSAAVAGLQSRLVRGESAEAASLAKVDALRDVKDAKSLLKASLPQVYHQKEHPQPRPYPLEKGSALTPTPSRLLSSTRVLAARVCTCSW